MSKEKSIGFDYRVVVNDDGLPVCITWMTPQMRKDQIRFGDVLFLDAQKRQYNQWGFPYCGQPRK